MSHQNLVTEYQILEIQSGSHLYGTNVPTSDIDYVGVFIAPKRFYLGLERIEEVDLGIVSKGEDGKNLPDAIDRKFYELRNFIHLAKGGNPNIVEILFVNDANVVKANGFGQRLRRNAELFVSEGVRTKYLGYSQGQKKMMVNKPDNFAQTVAAVEWLDNWIAMGRDPGTRIAAILELMVNAKVAEDKVSHLSIGKANYCTSMTVRKLRAALAEKLAKITNRQDLWTKYGYDTKFAMHLLRLLTEGIELLTTGRIEFPLRNREFLLDVRAGKFSKEEVLVFAEELEAELKVVKAVVPDHPDFHRINQLLMDMVEESWDEHTFYLT